MSDDPATIAALVLAAALTLRSAADPDFGAASVSFSHLPVALDPQEALPRLRRTFAGSLLLPDGELLTIPPSSPTDRSFPSTPIRPTSSGRISPSELELRLVFENGATVQESVGLHAGPGHRSPALPRRLRQPARRDRLRR